MKVFLALLVVSVIAAEARKNTKDNKCAWNGLCEHRILGAVGQCCLGYECQEIDADSGDKWCVRTLIDGENCAKYRGVCGEGMTCCNGKCTAEECVEVVKENNGQGQEKNEGARRKRSWSLF